MEDEKQTETTEEPKPAKPAWQATKESWYDHLNVTVKQLDIVIGVASALLVLVFIRIFLVALHII